MSAINQDFLPGPPLASPRPPPSHPRQKNAPFFKQRGIKRRRLLIPRFFARLSWEAGGKAKKGLDLEQRRSHLWWRCVVYTIMVSRRHRGELCPLFPLSFAMATSGRRLPPWPTHEDTYIYNKKPSSSLLFLLRGEAAEEGGKK